jgi:hypothetical protein
MLWFSVEGWLILLINLFELANLSLDVEVRSLGFLMLEDLSFERSNLLFVLFFLQFVISPSSQGALDFFKDNQHFFKSVRDRILLGLNIIGFKLSEVTGGFRFHLFKDVGILTDF